MRAAIFLSLVIAVQVDSQFWKYPQQFLNNFAWLRQGKTGGVSELPPTTTPAITSMFTTKITSPGETTKPVKVTNPSESGDSRTTFKKTTKSKVTTTPITTGKPTTTKIHTTPIWSTIPVTTLASTRTFKTTINVTATTATDTEATTMLLDTTTQEVTGTTEEPRDNHRVHDFYLSKREKPQVKIASNISQVSSNT